VFVAANTDSQKANNRDSISPEPERPNGTGDADMESEAKPFIFWLGIECDEDCEAWDQMARRQVDLMRQSCAPEPEPLVVIPIPIRIVQPIPVR
jgi:hypothetical protein